MIVSCVGCRLVGRRPRSLGLSLRGLELGCVSSAIVEPLAVLFDNGPDVRDRVT